MSIEIKRVTGSHIENYLDAVAKLRIDVFSEFPYLYDGSVEYERQYLARYTISEHVTFVLACDGPDIVGVSIAIPLAQERPEFQDPFIEAGFDLLDVFYFAESVLMKSYRGQGIGKQFFYEREAHAKAAGDYKYATFCAVQRRPDDPRRPADYRPLDGFWEKMGYVRRNDLHTEFAWKERGESEDSPKPMVFWLKQLED